LLVLLSLSGVKLSPFVIEEEQIKWISEIMKKNFIDILNGKKWVK